MGIFFNTLDGWRILILSFSLEWVPGGLVVFLFLLRQSLNSFGIFLKEASSLYLFCKILDGKSSVETDVVVSWRVILPIKMHALALSYILTIISHLAN